MEDIDNIDDNLILFSKVDDEILPSNKDNNLFSENLSNHNLFKPSNFKCTLNFAMSNLKRYISTKYNIDELKFIEALDKMAHHLYNLYKKEDSTSNDNYRIVNYYRNKLKIKKGSNEKRNIYSIIMDISAIYIYYYLHVNNIIHIEFIINFEDLSKLCIKKEAFCKGDKITPFQSSEVINLSQNEKLKLVDYSNFFQIMKKINSSIKKDYSITIVDTILENQGTYGSTQSFERSLIHSIYQGIMNFDIQKSKRLNNHNSTFYDIDTINVAKKLIGLKKNIR